MAAVAITRGESPLILGQPHGGVDVPEEIWSKLNDNGRKLADTDWHIGQLYEGLATTATVVAATFHRYVIDANRDPAGVSLYPGQNTTSLCPTTDFDGLPIYRPGQEPTAAETAQRRAEFHAAYHAALGAEIQRIKQKHGFAILYDCHSIRGHIPFLFDGLLPDLNIGTNGGETCAESIERIVVSVAARSGFRHVLNGRFRGGWTTRHYGRPLSGFHAIQMEIAQSAYLETETPPWTFSAAKAAKLRPVLHHIITALEGFRP